MTTTTTVTGPVIAEAEMWTIAYRKRTGPVFHRVTNWSGTWAQAYEMAQAFGELHPELQVWYATTLAYEQAAALEVAAGTLSDSYAEDFGNIMVDSGKRIKVRDNGTLPADLLDDEINNVAAFMLLWDKRPVRGDLDEWRFWARDVRENHPETYRDALKIMAELPDGTPRGRFGKNAH